MNFLSVAVTGAAAGRAGYVLASCEQQTNILIRNDFTAGFWTPQVVSRTRGVSPGPPCGGLLPSCSSERTLAFYVSR